MPTPAKCLLLLRDQVNGRWPGRPKTSDGILGDPAHQARKSDHNEGNAIDITAWPGGPDLCTHLAEAFRRQMRANPAGRITYMIWRRRICSPQSSWAWRVYTGPNPHTTHLHISIDPRQREVLRPWKLD